MKAIGQRNIFSRPLVGSSGRLALSSAARPTADDGTKPSDACEVAAKNFFTRVAEGQNG